MPSRGESPHGQGPDPVRLNANDALSKIMQWAEVELNPGRIELTNANCICDVEDQPDNKEGAPQLAQVVDSQGVRNACCACRCQLLHHLHTQQVTASSSEGPSERCINLWVGCARSAIEARSGRCAARKDMPDLQMLI